MTEQYRIDPRTLSEDAFVHLAPPKAVEEDYGKHPDVLSLWDGAW